MTTTLIGHRLGDFEIVRELGRGGMGVVYEARQLSLGRHVAIKVLAHALAAEPRAIDRFRREAAAAAKLQHTNIVPVYLTGEQDGVHFYAMELIDGQSLDVVLRGWRAAAATPAAAHLPADLAATGPYVTPQPAPSDPSVAPPSDRFDRIAAMAADVADALHHAHQHGVTHRDVKPSNLLQAADGRLSVTDFGLASLLDQPGVTVTGEFVGTPAYTSPEQSAGSSPVDHRTDVYSLGATLYEMLTLRPPFVADGRDRLLYMVQHAEPARPRAVDPQVPRDLETICLKCLEKDPGRRYPDAKELADDLRRYLNRFAIRARRPGPLARLDKWVRRNKAVSAAAVVVLLSLGLAAFSAWRANEADRRRAAEILVERRQTALEKAILDAMSADSEAALVAIANAEELGAEPGQLYLMRGLTEMTRGRPGEALVHLRQAERLLGRTVAVEALLAQALNDDGQWAEYEGRMMDLTRAEPATFEDHLFLGLAFAELDPPRAVASVDRVLDRPRPAAVARLIRATALGRLAQVTGNPTDADRALADLEKLDLPDNMLYLNLRRSVLLIAANNYGRQTPRGVKAVAEARELNDRLRLFPDQVMAAVGRCMFFMITGDEDSLLREVTAARKRFANTYLDDFAVYAHYRRLQFTAALQVARPPDGKADPNAANGIRHGIVLAALPGQAAAAEAAFADALRRYRRGPGLAGLPGYWQLLGPAYRARTREACRETMAKEAHLIPDWRDRWYHHLLAFHAEAITADALWARAGESRWNRCEGGFFIGLRMLGEGKREQAKEWFGKSVETGVDFCCEEMWSRAFLACLDDPSWPPWQAGRK